MWSKEFHDRSKVRRRSFVSGLTAIGASGLGSGTVVARSKKGPDDESEEASEIYEKWENKHGAVLDIQSREVNQSARRYEQRIQFEDGTEKTIDVHYLSDTECWSRIEGNRYFSRGEPLTASELEANREQLPEFGEGVPSGTITMKTGDTKKRTTAEKFLYGKSGAGLGTKLNRHTLSRFEGEAFVSVGGIGWAGRTTDVFVDVYIDEPTTSTRRLTAEFDLFFRYMLAALGGSATATGTAIIRDLSANKNLTVAQAYNRSRELLDFREWSGSSNPIIAANVQGGRTYRVGIRAFNEASVWLLPYAASDSYRAEGNERYFRARSLQIDLK